MPNLIYIFYNRLDKSSIYELRKSGIMRALKIIIKIATKHYLLKLFMFGDKYDISNHS